MAAAIPDRVIAYVEEIILCLFALHRLGRLATDLRKHDGLGVREELDEMDSLVTSS